ncbi:ROK family protein [Microbacterium sp.]|uniref:ROK family protein n=1 Tax=Microbacterium sp. TaxID=51671 RepID=UPI00334000EA
MEDPQRRPHDPAGTGTNRPRGAEHNEAVVLDAVRRGARTRVDLVEATGLVPQTISNISRRLLDAGLLREAGKERIAGHRKPRTLLELDPAGCYAVGVHVDPAAITFVLLDFTGRVVAESSRPTPPVRDPRSVTALLAARIGEIIAQSGVDPDRVLGVGVATPGPVDTARGVVLDPPHLPGWQHVPLRESLRAATGRPVLLEKDVIACAVAEQWAGAGGAAHDFAFLYMATGVGIGFVMDGAVVRGISGNAGDVGLLAVTADEIGERFTGDFRAFWEVGSPRALVADAVAAGVLGGESAEDGEDPARIGARFGALCDAADAGDERAAGILDRAARYAASAVLTVTNLLDVDAVVLGGTMWERAAARFLPIMAPIVARVSSTRRLHEIGIRGTALGEDVAAIGAGCLVLEDRFSARPPRLSPRG